MEEEEEQRWRQEVKKDFKEVRQRRKERELQRTKSTGTAVPGDKQERQADWVTEGLKTRGEEIRRAARLSKAKGQRTRKRNENFLPTLQTRTHCCTPSSTVPLPPCSTLRRRKSMWSSSPYCFQTKARSRWSGSWHARGSDKQLPLLLLPGQ